MLLEFAMENLKDMVLLWKQAPGRSLFRGESVIGGDSEITYCSSNLDDRV